MADLIIRQGITKQITIQCNQISDGVSSAIDLTGFAAAAFRMVLQGGGTTVVFSVAAGTLSIPTPSNGQIIIAPVGDELTQGVYFAFLKVTDSLGKVLDFPSERNFDVRVLGTY